MSEYAIEGLAVAYMLGAGAYVAKHPGSLLTGSGLPDRVACYLGYFVALEFKDIKIPLASSHGGLPVEADDQYADAPQRFHLQQIRKAGGYAYVVNNVEVVKALFASILEQHRDR